MSGEAYPIRAAVLTVVLTVSWSDWLSANPSICQPDPRFACRRKPCRQSGLRRSFLLS